MGRHVVLLRGINLAGRNRIAMPELREALTEAGFKDVGTLLQSGNVVLSSGKRAATVERACEEAIAERFGLQIPVVTRTRDELAQVVDRDPLGDIATDPKRYQVTFLASKLSKASIDKVAATAAEPERLVVVGREAYAWHPDGVGRSRLATALAGRALGVTATARNWSTVGKLLALADE